MEIFSLFLRVFLVGGLFCLIGQLLIDRTKLTPARILTMYVIAGVMLSAVGVYEPLCEWAGSGATVPLTGFGHLLAKGVRQGIAESGFSGIFTGGISSAAGGICAAVVFGLIVSILFRSREKY